MIKTFSTEEFVVYDDVLNDEEFERIHSFVEKLPMNWINQNEWRTVNKILDGASLESQRIAFLEKNRNSIDEIKKIFSVISDIIESDQLFLKNYKNNSPCSLSGRFTAYPQETRLSWHQDGIERKGAYSFYLHKNWNVQWGGELQCALPTTAPENVTTEWENRVRKLQHIDNTLQNQMIMNPGISISIIPKPNRLVLLSSKTHHMINRVDKSAGDHIRLALSGFIS